METMKDSGVRWIGEIPATWSTKRIKYMATLKGRIGWQGLTSEEYQDEGAYLITGVDFDNGGIDWENCVHVPMKRWEEAKEIQIENGDLLITKDGTIGKVAIVSNMPGETSLNSGVLRIIPIEGYSRRFLYWVIKSDEFWTWFNYKNAGNSPLYICTRVILRSSFMLFRISMNKKLSQTTWMYIVVNWTVLLMISKNRLRR